MTPGQAVLARGLPLHAHLHDDPRLYRVAEQSAPFVVLGRVTAPDIAAAMAPKDARLAGAVLRHIESVAQRLDRHVFWLERDIKRLLDRRIGEQGSPADIEAEVVALVAAQPEPVYKIMRVVGWDDLIRERLNAWRWRKSPHGRRALQGAEA